MFYQIDLQKDIMADYKKSCTEAIGLNVEEHTVKLAWLKEKWNNARDSHPARLICPMLSEPVSAFHHSIISNNLGYFKLNYNKNEVNSNALLAIACLCGSEDIANFLLKQLGSNYLSTENEYVLGYVLASQNTKWAKNIASTLALAGKKMPGDLRDFADRSMVEAIGKIFQGNKTINDNDFRDRSP